MVKKIITQKKETVSPRASGDARREAGKVEVEAEVETKTPLRSKKCQFCQNKSTPSYTDTAGLRRLLTDRAKITPRLKNGLCSKHQRFSTREIKYARHLGLLPFTPKV